MFNFLQNDCKLWLDEEQSMGSLYMRSLCDNTKTRIPRADARPYKCPQYEGLTKADLLEYASSRPQVMACLPDDPKEQEKLHRDFISTVINTVVGQPFEDWVEARTQARNQRIAQQQNQLIYVDPQIAQAINNSTQVSTHRGVTNHLFKVSRPRQPPQPP